MEIKTISDCLNFIDSMILCSIEKHVGIGNDKYLQEMVSILGTLSQVNLIIDIFYLDNESDIKKPYCTLRKRILAWLQESNTDCEVDNDE